MRIFQKDILMKISPVFLSRRALTPVQIRGTAGILEDTCEFGFWMDEFDRILCGFLLIL